MFTLTAAQIATFSSIIADQAEYEDMLASGVRPARVHLRKKDVQARKDALSFEDTAAFIGFRKALRAGATVQAGMVV